MHRSTRRSFAREAATALRMLIENITINPNGERGPEAELVAKLSDLMAFATNDNAAPKGGVVVL